MQLCIATLFATPSASVHAPLQASVSLVALFDVRRVYVSCSTGERRTQAHSLQLCLKPRPAGNMSCTLVAATGVSSRVMCTHHANT